MLRYATFALTLALTLGSLILGAVVSRHFLWPLLPLAPLAAIGVWDLVQRPHSLLRNYPILAHMRWLFEGIRPEIRQYLIESDQDAAPFDREQRSLVYQRAKGTVDRTPFGTLDDLYADGAHWLNHSIRPAPVAEMPFRVEIGGPDSSKPYSSSLLNVSAMSYGSLSANAVRALNLGARQGGFAHDTGEGGISAYHREFGGDLIWEIGTGYFGCRRDDGGFDPEMFAEEAAREQVRMVEIKLSQGAKPGHGGVLPGAKVTPEIAAARRLPMGRDCISPAAHGAFATPIEMMRFIATLRDAAGGKPVGFKLCIGHRFEFLALCKAMLETGIRPDFIVVDGAEGGTGAAPLEFSDHIGTPLADGLRFVRDALVGTGLRDEIRIGASGKIISAADIARTISLGADWCNAARGFMFALGCIQSRSCHTNRCPVGVATQDRWRQRALVVADKADRVRNFHHNTLETLAEVVAAAGLASPSDFRPWHFQERRAASLPEPLSPGELLDGTDRPDFAQAWCLARPDSFAPDA
ncbi:MAG: FMN-binding glutamate synthase family protein [Alphaproteobacteria bacterium]|jgi:glutamate synthase domain-containing protein 2|nr:FMN-binding glutamate synthase family protein [Alphaproteobacteria bacterium]